MGEEEKDAWYERQKAEPIFDNMSLQETNCQDGVTDLKQTCRVFRREIMHTGNTEVLLESITIASAGSAETIPTASHYRPHTDRTVHM